MGLCAEKTVSDFKLTRELQDDYAISSYERTISAIKSGKFIDEIVPVQINEKEKVIYNCNIYYSSKKMKK